MLDIAFRILLSIFCWYESLATWNCVYALRNIKSYGGMDKLLYHSSLWWYNIAGVVILIFYGKLYSGGLLFKFILFTSFMIHLIRFLSHFNFKIRTIVHDFFFNKDGPYVKDGLIFALINFIFVCHALHYALNACMIYSFSVAVTIGLVLFIMLFQEVFIFA